MASVANPARPLTYNAFMTAAGWGTLYCRVMDLTLGMSIVSSGQSKSRIGRTIYLTQRTGGSFDASFVCTSFEEYNAFGQWMQGYGRAAASNSPSVGPVRLVCPSRRFDKAAIPRGMEFGDKVTPVTYRFSISFVGASEALPIGTKEVSSFSLPSGTDDRSLPYYYPGGTQLSGDDKGVDSFFDRPPVAINDALRGLSRGGGGGNMQVQ